MSKDEKNNVVFRRIHGRIVPIAVGAGAIAAGHKLNVEKHGMKIQQKSLNMLEKITEKYRPAPFQKNQEVWNTYYRNEGVKVKALKNIYAPELKKLNTAVQINITSQSYFRPDGMVSPYISVRSGNPAVFLHELGHSAQRTGIIRKLENSARKFHNVNAGILNSKMMGWKYKPGFKLGVKQKAINIAASANIKFGNMYRPAFKKLGEIDAWARAFKYAKTPKMKLDVVKTSVPALGTYLGKDIVKLGRLGLFTAGAAAIGYGLLKRDKKK